MKKSWKICALSLAVALVFSLCGVLTGCGDKNNPKGPGEGTKTEITYKGKTGQGSDQFMGDPQDVYWIDASVQKANSYTKIVGFKLTAKINKLDSYGGGKEDGSMRCGMVLTTKGAHLPEEYVFTYPGGQFPEYALSQKDIVAFGMGDAEFVVSMAFANTVRCGNDLQDGDTVTMTYTGESAVFSADDPVMTVVSFLGAFEYQSVEWILGEPEEIEEEPWDEVETDEYLDISTVGASVTNNGNNYVDITVPKLNKASYPVVLWIHGGGYITGDRKNCILSMTKKYMLAQGYAWVSAEYTLTKTETVNNKTVYKQGGMPQMLHDLKTAVRFLRANAATYKLDTRFIVTMGESAGAGLSLLMATSNGLTGPNYEDTSMGWADQSSAVQAAGGICPPTCFTGKDFIKNMYAYLGEGFNDYLGDDADKKAEIEALAKAWSPTELIPTMLNNDTFVPLFMSFSKEDTTVPQAHYNAIKKELEQYFSAEEMEEEGIVINNYSKGGHVDRGTFDTYTAYVTFANWCNVQRDKVLG